VVAVFNKGGGQMVAGIAGNCTGGGMVLEEGQAIGDSNGN